MSSQTNPEPGNTETSRRGWWWIAALAGVAVVALLVYLAVRPDDDSATTETDPADDSSEMSDDMTDDMPTDDATDDMAEDDMSDETSDDEMSEDDMSGDDMSDDDMSGEDAAVDEKAQDQSPSDASPGVYREYSEELLAAPGFERNILFVHAGWCPECRAFDESLNGADIPAGVQFLKIDYDSNRDELGQKYGVDIQSTFVEVDDQGEKISLWVGYEKDRSLETIFEGLAAGMDG